MGEALSSIPLPEDFGVPEGFDARELHDRAWMESLEELSARHFAIPEGALARFRAGARPHELYVCRMVHRAYRGLNRLLMSEDELEFTSGLYFTTMLQPSFVMQLCLIVHLCALMGREPMEELPDTLGRSLVQNVYRTYVEEQPHVLGERRETQAAAGLYKAVNSTLQMYLELLRSAVEETSEDEEEQPPSE